MGGFQAPNLQEGSLPHGRPLQDHLEAKTLHPSGPCHARGVCQLASLQKEPAQELWCCQPGKKCLQSLSHSYCVPRHEL